jgi:hypothetical protein
MIISRAKEEEEEEEEVGGGGGGGFDDGPGRAPGGNGDHASSS